MRAVNVLVFDIETVPDVASGRRLYQLDGLDDAAVATAMFTLRRQQTGGSDFLRHHLQRVVAISALLRTGDRLKVWSLGDIDASEAEILGRFFEGIERYSPMLVSWNGGGFDLPVLHYRALVNGVSAARYWETGDDDSSFRYNNYLSRYHWRHLDLMDVLAGYQPRAVASLDDIATMMGFPGKLGMDGSKVWDAWLAGNLQDIRDYCETDVINTYLVYLRFEQMRGRLSAGSCEEEMQRLREYLRGEKRAHLDQFLEAWAA
jgi:hypothetical protein